MQYEDKNGVNEPSRRRLLKGIGALALAGSCPVAHAQKTQSAPGTASVAQGQSAHQTMSDPPIT